MVNGMHYRHPAVTANMAATVDIISGGRLELGMGAGWNLEESNAYGIELRLGEGAPRPLRGGRRGDRPPAVAGDHRLRRATTSRITDARCEPKPVQQPHPPLLIGGSGKKRTLAVVARWAQKWDGGLQRDRRPLAGEERGAARHCQRLGRDPAGDLSHRSHRVAAGADPSALADQAAELVDAGVDQVIFSMRGPVPGQRGRTAGRGAAKLYRPDLVSPGGSTVRLFP